jgi:hypothetical protein
MFGFWFKTKQNANRHPAKEPEEKQNRKTVFFTSQFVAHQGVGHSKKRKEPKHVKRNLSLPISIFKNMILY